MGGDWELEGTDLRSEYHFGTFPGYFLNFVDESTLWMRYTWWFATWFYHWETHVLLNGSCSADSEFAIYITGCYSTEREEGFFFELGIEPTTPILQHHSVTSIPYGTYGILFYSIHTNLKKKFVPKNVISY